MSVGLTALAIVTLLAFVNESMVEWLFGAWLDKDRIKYVALVGGLVLAFGFNVGLLHTLAGLDVNSYADRILSGLVMARGSQFVHDFYSQFLRPGTRPFGGIGRTGGTGGSFTISAGIADQLGLGTVVAPKPT